MSEIKPEKYKSYCLFICHANGLCKVGNFLFFRNNRGGLWYNSFIIIIRKKKTKHSFKKCH